jgi:hypothetical protein
MTAVMHMALVALGWLLTVYVVVLGVIFVCLLLAALAALLHFPHRNDLRLPEDDCLVRVLEREGYLP